MGNAASGAFAMDYSNASAVLQFAQAPGKTTSMNVVSFTNEGPSDVAYGAGMSFSYEFRLMDYGNLRAGTATGTNAACKNMGNQFRPLKEVDAYGRVNPFQDPSRGVIPSCAAGTSTASTTGGVIPANTKMRNILISLSGKDSIIGRGIAMYNEMPVSASNATKRNANPVGCCVVALDMPPIVNIAHHHHYGYGHAHGHSHGHDDHSYDSHGHDSHGHDDHHGHDSYGYEESYERKSYGHDDHSHDDNHGGYDHGGYDHGYVAGGHGHGYIADYAAKQEYERGHDDSYGAKEEYEYGHHDDGYEAEESYEKRDSYKRRDSGFFGGSGSGSGFFRGTSGGSQFLKNMAYSKPQSRYRRRY